MVLNLGKVSAHPDRTTCPVSRHRVRDEKLSERVYYMRRVKDLLGTADARTLTVEICGITQNTNSDASARRIEWLAPIAIVGAQIVNTRAHRVETHARLSCEVTKRTQGGSDARHIATGDSTECSGLTVGPLRHLPSVGAVRSP